MSEKVALLCFSAFVIFKMPSSPVNTIRVVAVLVKNCNSMRRQLAKITGFSRSSMNRADICFQLPSRI